ncbi:EamA-like transporter family protein [Kribbella antibiotica]|uniref:EamA-like transporter family protein n=1 Tax=Kribbella antibiotica TaxID=190195 RepID=A0A4R4YIY5_9ACTN|nr:DMT family transporter [Kribbella antibiotica]TDD44891.1 EamA-like transporter family protein [Kribbella antibiotica]
MTVTANRPEVSVHRQQAAGLAAAFGIGALFAIQSRLNGGLGELLGDGIPAALISFGTGLVILAIVAALVPGIRRALGNVWRAIRDPLNAGGLRWWQCIGGLCGAWTVAVQSVTVHVLGVAVFIVAGVAGQAGSSLIVDRLGLGPAGRQGFSTLRIVGAVIAVVAVVLAVSDQFGHPGRLLLAILPALGGVASAFQQAINGRVAQTAAGGRHGAVAAGAINFAVGFAALLVVFGIDLALRGAPNALPGNPWLYLGGACGVIFMSVAAAVVRVVGVFVLGLGTIAGQLIGSLLIDLFAPAADKPVTFPVVAGAALALVAVVVASLPKLRRDEPDRPHSPTSPAR